MPQASPPAATPPAQPRDRVTLVVRLTLLLLLVVGVLSIFGESLLGLAEDEPGGPAPAPRADPP